MSSCNRAHILLSGWLLENQISTSLPLLIFDTEETLIKFHRCLPLHNTPKALSSK